jgi:SAM-dependent methyltransferase
VEDGDYATTYAIEAHNWWFVGTRRICLSLLDEALPMDSAEPPRIVDVGCGTGLLLEHLASRGSTLGIDVSPLALGFCRQRSETRLVQADAVRLPLPDGSADALTAIGVIEHLDDDAAALAEWRRVLRPGGAVVLLTSSYEWMWSGHDVSNHHVRRYTVDQLRDRLASAGLRATRMSYVNSILFPPIAAVRLAQRVARHGRPPAPHKDTGEVPTRVNAALTAVLDVERRVLLRRPLPFGVSMVAAAVAE